MSTPALSSTQPYTVAQAQPPEDGQVPPQTQQNPSEQTTPPGVSAPKTSGADVQQAAATMYRDADAALKWGWEQAGFKNFEAPTTHYDRVVMAAKIAAALKGEDLAAFLGKMADAGQAFGINWGLRENVTSGAPLNAGVSKSLDRAFQAVHAQMYSEWAQGAGLSPTSTQTQAETATPAAPGDTASEVPPDATDPGAAPADAQPISQEEAQQALAAVTAVLSQIDKDGNGSLSVEELTTAAQASQGEAKALYAAGAEEVQASGAAELPVAEVAQSLVDQLLQGSQQTQQAPEQQPSAEEQSTTESQSQSQSRAATNVSTGDKSAAAQAEVTAFLQEIDKTFGTKNDGLITVEDLQQAKSTQGLDETTAAVLGLAIDLMAQAKVDSASVQELATVLSVAMNQPTAQPQDSQPTPRETVEA